MDDWRPMLTPGAPDGQQKSGDKKTTWRKKTGTLPRKLTAGTWKWMLGILVDYWGWPIFRECTRWFKPWPFNIFNPLVGGHQQPLKGSLFHHKKHSRERGNISHRLRKKRKIIDSKVPLGGDMWSFPGGQNRFNDWKACFFELLFLLFFGFLMVFLECSECKNVAKYFESLGKCSEGSLFRIRLLRMGKTRHIWLYGFEHASIIERELPCTSISENLSRTI